MINCEVYYKDSDKLIGVKSFLSVPRVGDYIYFSKTSKEERVFKVIHDFRDGFPKIMIFID